MEANTNEDITLEEIEKREKRFESLKKFFESDMQLKQTLLELAPTEKDDFNEESRMQYTDKLYKELRDIEREFLSMINSLGLSPSSADAITKHFDKAREAFLVSRYEPGVIQKLYKTQFSDMSLQLIETVKNRCIGYTGRANLSQLIKSSCSINELLHVMHSYIINNENILQAMPMISINKKEGYYPIRLYGEENEISRKIFDEFPLDESVGWTDIISMQNKILMMIRDKGHALTIDMDISKDEGVLLNILYLNYVMKG